jgi:hypothetical protein
MAITPATRYSVQEDCVVGLDGSGGDMANLLLVFMLRGTYKNWKQPIGYYLISHSVKAEELKSLILEGLRVAHEANIKVRYSITFTVDPVFIYHLSRQI